MQDFDPIEDHFRNTFSGRESAPPQDSWEKIRSRLQASSPRQGKAMRLVGRGRQFFHSSSLYPVLAVSAILILLVFIWISYSAKHTIRGHAYAGEERLCRGTAYLFTVADKAEPIDTGKTKLIQKVKVDAKGFYQFTGISQGEYLILVVPDTGTEAMKNFLPSYYDQDSEEYNANLVRIRQEDPTLDIHLQPRK